MVYLYPYEAGIQAPSFIETDKIEPHGYFTQYLKIAAELGPQAKVCEVGVFNGESLRMWQGLFPMGEVTGVDNNPSAIWPPGTTRVVKNQDDPSLADLGTFDLIVDDASHKGELSGRTFQVMWPRLNPGGYYVIEDWVIGLHPEWADYEPGMLEVAQALVGLLSLRDSECDSVLFRYGLAIAHRRKL